MAILRQLLRRKLDFGLKEHRNNFTRFRRGLKFPRCYGIYCGTVKIRLEVLHNFYVSHSSSRCYHE